MDLSKLTDDAEFIALARNAFEVMMRRGWWPLKKRDGWTVSHASFKCPDGRDEMLAFARETRFTDPFSALIVADRFYRKNVEKDI